MPAIDEFLPGYEASGWYGISAPKDTPPEIVERLNKAVNAGLIDPKTEAAPRRPRLPNLGRVARRFRQVYRRRNREVDQGDPRRRHQGGVSGNAIASASDPPPPDSTARRARQPQPHRHRLGACGVGPRQ